MRTASAFVVLAFVLALFSACASSPASSDNPLAGTSWELRTLVEGSDSLTTVPRDGLYFMDDGGIRMRSCNACYGFYTAEGNRLMTSRMVCTRRLCEQDRPELALLIGETSTYRLHGDWLIIETGGMGSKRLYLALEQPLEGN